MKNARRLIESCNITQRALAQLLDTSESTLSKIAKGGRVDLGVAERLAEITNHTATIRDGSVVFLPRKRRGRPRSAGKKQRERSQ